MKTKITLLIALAVTLVSTMLSGCGSNESGNSLNVKYLAFVPATKTVRAGTTITWTNNDQTAHQLMSKKLFKSKPLNPGQAYSFKFSKKGEHSYMCSIHPYMQAKIIVE